MRYYNSDLSIWLSVDPMSDKYPSTSPYTYCGNNPVKLVDPNGTTVVAEDEMSKNNIKNTLTIKEARYVHFNKNGVLNDRKLQRCKSTSENITALKELSKSKQKYHFQVTGKTHAGETFSNEGKTFKGVTEIPGATEDPSPDNDVWILTSSLLDGESAAMNTAHEGYGHAYFYELKQQGQEVNPYHDYVSEPDCTMDEFGQLRINLSRYDANKLLDQQIRITTAQAKSNYNSRKKK